MRIVTLMAVSLGARLLPPRVETIVAPDEIEGAHTLLANGSIELLEGDADLMLLGSSTMPATFEVEGGGTLSLGDVVRAAFQASGLSAEAWNDLPDAKRDRRIAAAALLLDAVGEGEQQEQISSQREGADGMSADDVEAGAPVSTSAADSSTDARNQASEQTSPPGEADAAADATGISMTHASEAVLDVATPAIMPASPADLATPATESSGGDAGRPEAPAATPAPKVSVAADKSTKGASKKR